MRRLWLAAAVFAAGCGGGSPARPDTGSRDAAAEFFGGLAAGDPARAYDALDPDSRRRVPADRFAGLARAYTRNLGFPAEKVVVRACEERGDDATAHVALTGHAGGQFKRYEDGATLRRRDGRWGVVLAANFGQPTK